MNEAKTAHIREHRYLNKDRIKLGLTLCPEGIPTKLTEKQIQEEAIRRYNCGREFRWEPRDAPNCEGEWKHDLSCIRENIEGYDENYVRSVQNCKLND